MLNLTVDQFINMFIQTSNQIFKIFKSVVNTLIAFCNKKNLRKSTNRNITLLNPPLGEQNVKSVEHWKSCNLPNRFVLVKTKNFKIK